MIKASVCPHDCPSVCALNVEVTDEGKIGRLHGAEQPYTAGIICAKVARYAERVHHPDRLTTPLKRTGPKGSGSFTPIAWDEALDIIAARFLKATAQFGSEAVWPYHYAGTMGLVQRESIKRLRHSLNYSGMKETFCVAIADAGWNAGAGAKRGVDAREMAQSDLIVIWGGNPVHTQVNVMTWLQKAKRERGAKVVVIDPYRTASAEKADLHLAPRPGTDGALACAVMHVLFAEGYADRDYLSRYTDHPAGLNPIWPSAGPTGPPPSPAFRLKTSWPSPIFMAAPSAVSSASAMASPAIAMVPPPCMRSLACPRLAEPGPIWAAALCSARARFTA